MPGNLSLANAMVPTVKDDRAQSGSDRIAAEVVTDGNRITSSAPKDLPAFMKALIQARVRDRTA
jgi:putative intracellular protease/amidase